MSKRKNRNYKNFQVLCYVITDNLSVKCLEIVSKQAERDTIEIITILKREDIGKDKRIQELTNEVEELKIVVSKDIEC